MLMKLISAFSFLLFVCPSPSQGQSRLQTSAKNAGQITTKVDVYMKPILDINSLNPTPRQHSFHDASS